MLGVPTLPMPLRSFPLLLVLALICGAAAPGSRADEAAERLAAAHLLAFGRLPAAPAAASAPASVAQALETHRAELQADAPLRTAAARRAWFDAYGLAPTTDEAIAAAGPAPTYFELLAAHRAALAREPAAAEAVLHRAYRVVVAREAYPEEIAYWRRHEPLPFVLLVGCIEDWARRNRPGLMSTTGAPTIAPHGPRLVTVRISPAIAAEVRALLALPAPPAPDAVPRLLAVGGAGIATAGGMHLLVVGRDPTDR